MSLIPLYIFGIFIAVLLEEWIFRDYIVINLGKILNENKILLIFISSIFFAFFHFQYYNDYFTLISIFLFGVLYVILYLEYNTIWVPLGIHFGHNLFEYLLGSDIVNLTSNNSILYGNFRPIFTIIEIVLILYFTKKLCPTWVIANSGYSSKK